MAGDQTGDSAADSDDTIEAKVPRASAIAIHYPGYIRNTDRALDALGGEQNLHKALQEAAGFLKLRLRPEDQHSHPIFGERQQESGYVLRISRPRSQPDAQPTIQIACRVHAGYVFTGMADYQYLGLDNREDQRDLSALDERNIPAAAEPFRSQQPFLLVPPLFSKGDMPVAFAFRDQLPLKEADVEVAASRKRIISFYDSTLPPELPIDNKHYQTQELQPQLEKLKALLSDRPAWPVELLVEHIPGSTAASLTPALQALCYQFKTGPWKSLYLRCGFDPRASLDGRQYQLVTYRIPQEWNKAVKAAKAAGRPMKAAPLSKLLSFSAMPVYHTTYLQICDLAKADAAVSQLLQQAPVPPTPSEAYGWFTYSSNQQLQQALQIAFGKVLKQQQEQLEKQQQEQPQQETTEAGPQSMDVEQTAAAAAAAAAEPQQQQQKKQRPASPELEIPGTSPHQLPAAAVAAAADDQPIEGLVGMLGLDSAQDDLQQWLQEEAAAAVEHNAAAAAGSGGESTDAGLSEGETDWGLTSGGETSADEGTDADQFDGYNEDV